MLAKKLNFISQLQDIEHDLRCTLADMRSSYASVRRSIEQSHTVMAETRKALNEANDLLRTSGLDTRRPF